jgi:hypothetical protein
MSQVHADTSCVGIIRASLEQSAVSVNVSRPISVKIRIPKLPAARKAVDQTSFKEWAGGKGGGENWTVR